jgi:putative endonuclease
VCAWRAWGCRALRPFSASRPARVGDDKERLACTYLERRGLRLLERNYRCRRGEIDLVMRDTDTLVFVEVRFRTSSRFGTPAETVDSHKQRRLASAAAHYLQRHPTNLPCRFDVVAVNGANSIDWIRSAFDVA